ncbi:acyltransferase [Prosthecodimorpha staleyi]|uniref:Acyltransferase n=1 Tax=Prosthecodimorpha staleyi TaxID=2840188 RepID=A0A947D5E3_9HYPH|nr:acyltransferase [Prosthecodimorpha staleyi]MBT9288472.1 acyltransferase [Prosthecodimorpha staleyi]
MTDNPRQEFVRPHADLLPRILRRLLRTPERFAQHFERKIKLASCVAEDGAVLYPACIIANNRARDNIRIGRQSRILARLETMGHGGDIQIGAYCFIGERTNIWSANSIVIGDRVLISHDVNIHDSNSHSFSARARHQHFLDIFSNGHPPILTDVPSAPIAIGNDAWIGFGATVLKGVTIGEGAVVAARSVVTKDVAPYTVVAGFPAKVIRHLDRDINEEIEVISDINKVT